MNEFDVLGTQRALRNDKSLTSTQFGLLMAATLRADNGSCKVKMSIEGLAKDAKVSDKTARTAFQQPQVTKYMARIEGRTRAKDMWFHRIPVVITGKEEESTPVITTGKTPIPVTKVTIPVTDAAIPVTVTAHLPLHLPTTSTKEGASAPVDPSLHEKTPGPLLDENPTPTDAPTPSPLEEDLEAHAQKWAKWSRSHDWTAHDVKRRHNEEAAIYEKHGVDRTDAW